MSAPEWTCAACGFSRDTPNHELGCEVGRAEKAETLGEGDQAGNHFLQEFLLSELRAQGCDCKVEIGETNSGELGAYANHRHERDCAWARSNNVAYGDTVTATLIMS